jgi:hypothetical protein
VILIHHEQENQPGTDADAEVAPVPSEQASGGDIEPFPSGTSRVLSGFLLGGRPTHQMKTNDTKNAHERCPEPAKRREPPFDAAAPIL